MKGDQVRIEVKLPSGGGVGIQKSKASALARPYNRLLSEGKQIGRMNHVFFEDPSGHAYVLGSLCHTFTGMLLFFPALNLRSTIWEFSEKEGKKIVRTKQHIDHVTLEKNHEFWHVRTFREDGARGDRWPDYRTISIPESLNSFYWFGLSIREPPFLEVKPEMLILDYSVVKETETRLKAFQKAWPSREIPFHNVTLNESSIAEGEFLHFDFFIGPVDIPDGIFETYQPIRPPMLERVIEHTDSWKIRQRGHPVMIPDMKNRLWIVSSKHRGKLSEEAIIGGQLAEEK